MTDSSLIIRIGAKADEFDKELKKLKDKTKSLENGLAKTAKISAAAFAGLTAAVGVAVTKFRSFEKSFTNVQTLLDKSSFSTKTLSKGIKDLRNDVLKLGASSGENFNTLNQALFDLISAGVPAEEATAALTDAVELATAGATDTATAVKALTASITAYGEEAGDTQAIAEKFFTAQKFGVTTVGELASGFNKVAGTAKALKIGFNEILAASTALTANGAKPTKEAFTEMNAVLNAVVLAQSKLAGQSEEVQNALSLQNIEQVGIVQALNDVRAATGGSVVELQKLLGSSEAVSAALSLTGQQAGTYSKILGELNDEQARAAAFSDALATKQATTDKAIERLSRSVESITIQLGERFAPLINDIADGLSRIAQRFSELTDEQKDSIANFIKASIAIAGVVAGLSTFALAAIKVIRFVKVLKTVFLAGRIAAAAFTGALTLGLGTILSFLPEIISGVTSLITLFNKKEEPESLVEINRQLDALRKKQDDINNAVGLRSYERQAQLEGLNEEIDRLEDLRKARLAIENQKSDGSILLRPETENIDPFAGLDDQLAGGKAVEIPLQPVVEKPETTASVEDEEAQKVKEAEEKKAEALRQAEEKKKAIEEQARNERIEALQNEQEILKAISNEATAEELDFLKRKQELKAEQAEVAQIKDKEEAATAKENLKLKNEALLNEEKAYGKRKLEEKIVQNEQDKALQQELDALTEEEQALFNEKQLEEFRNQILTKSDIEQQAASEKLNKDIQERNQFLKDEKAHGTAVATLRKVLNKTELQGATSAASDLAQLQNSKNKTLKAIGKRAAQAQITVDTAQGAASIFAKLNAAVPFAAPVIGAAGAAAILAYGGERIAQVNAAQRGGIVPSAGGGARDRVPMLLEPNELVVPKGLAPDFIQSVGRPDAQASGDSEAQGSMVEISIEDDATDFITAKQRENTDLAIGVA